jgi:hypothetical protein
MGDDMAKRERKQWGWRRCVEVAAGVFVMVLLALYTLTIALEWWREL